MAREPKVMWSARLPGGLVEQIVEVAEEEGVSQGELVEQVMAEWLDDRSVAHRNGRPFVSAADEAARAGLARVETYLSARGQRPTKIVVGCIVDDGGAVVGAADLVTLASDAVEFATIAAGAAGKQLRIVTDGDG